MGLCKDKLNKKTAHFRLPSVAQKRCMLKLPIVIGCLLNPWIFAKKHAQE